MITPPRLARSFGVVVPVRASAIAGATTATVHGEYRPRAAAALVGRGVGVIVDATTSAPTLERGTPPAVRDAILGPRRADIMGELVARRYPTAMYANLADHTYVECGTGAVGWACWGGKTGGTELRRGAGSTQR